MSKINSNAETKAQEGFKQAGAMLMTPITAEFEKSAVVLRPKRSIGEFAKKIARRTSSIAQRRVTIKSPNTPRSNFILALEEQYLFMNLFQIFLWFKQVPTTNYAQNKILMDPKSGNEFHSMKDSPFQKPTNSKETVSVDSQEKFQIIFPDRFH